MNVCLVSVVWLTLLFLVAKTRHVSLNSEPQQQRRKKVRLPGDDMDPYSDPELLPPRGRGGKHARFAGLRPEPSPERYAPRIQDPGTVTEVCVRADT